VANDVAQRRGHGRGGEGRGGGGTTGEMGSATGVSPMALARFDVGRGGDGIGGTGGTAELPSRIRRLSHNRNRAGLKSRGLER
jgi:hypothetical protein